jgi:hypothetical protein
MFLRRSLALAGMTLTQQIEKADRRIVILGSGKLKDTGDPYVEFAFKE